MSGYSNEGHFLQLLAAMQKATLGLGGGKIITDTTDCTGLSGVAVIFTESSVIDTLTVDGMTVVGPGYGTKTFPAGLVIYGRISQVKLTSGSCIVYNNIDPETIK